MGAILPPLCYRPSVAGGSSRLPDSFETARLRLRAPRAADVGDVHAAVVESFPELHAWMPWARERPTAADIEAWLRRAAAGFAERSSFELVMREKGTGALVGVCGLPRLDWNVPKFEIGYWCRTRFTGRGYVTEAVRAVTALAFDRLGAARVEVRCDEANERSRRVIERCGFRLEGALRNEQRTPTGGLRTTLVFSLTPEEYRALAP
jgi:RimJ/RimL family protein N-acetyltransferase